MEPEHHYLRIWVPKILDGCYNPTHGYRLTQDGNGVWFVAHPGDNHDTAIARQPFADRKSASEHVEYLLAVKELERK